MSATAFLTVVLAAAVIVLAAAGAAATRATDTTTGPAGVRSVTPLARRLADDAAWARTAAGRSARAVVIGIYLPAVNRARLMPTRRLARQERRLRRAHARGRVGAGELVALAAARMVLAERGRRLPPLAARPALPRLVEGASQ